MALYPGEVDQLLAAKIHNKEVEKTEDEQRYDEWQKQLVAEFAFSLRPRLLKWYKNPGSSLEFKCSAPRKLHSSYGKVFVDLIASEYTGKNHKLVGTYSRDMEQDCFLSCWYTYKSEVTFKVVTVDPK